MIRFALMYHKEIIACFPLQLLVNQKLSTHVVLQAQKMVFTKVHRNNAEVPGVACRSLA